MRQLKVGSAAVLICAAFMFITACSDNDNRPRISGPASALPPAALGVAVNTTFTASGGDIMWSVTAGTLPPGLMLAATGQYTGTPTTVGSYAFTVTATNTFGNDTRAYTQDVTLPVSDSNALMTGNVLAAFPSTLPTGLETPLPVTGVATGEMLVSIDRRPQNGFLYGLGYNAAAGTVQLYSISATTAIATPIGTVGTFVGADGVTPARIGTDGTTTFGMDFNPTVDRVRVVNSAGQNFRMNPNNGALVDGNATAPGVNMDGQANGATMAVQETAYTNSSPSVTVTTQYTMDLTIDAVCIQNPPNAGTQTACQTLSIPVETVQGFDIMPGVVVTTSAAPASGSGLAVVRASGRTQDELVNVNLATGAVITNGPITNGIIGIALQQPAAAPLVALSADGTQLSRFLSNSPSTATTVAIAGVTAGETLVGIDYRPLTGQLYTLGVADALDNATLYILDPQTGTASVVGTASAIAFDDGTGVPVDLPPASAGYGFDFNPTVDRIRVVTGTGLNFRINPINGAPVDGNMNNTSAPPAGINTDGSLNGLPAASTGATAAAYTNSFGQGTGGVTTQYVLDPVSNTLFIQNPPNAGTVTVPQAVTLSGSPLDFIEASGFDIPSDVKVTTSAAPAVGRGFAALTVGTTTRLYAINLNTGAATDLGAIGMNVGGLAAGQTALR
jgi:hypothetical protein